MVRRYRRRRRYAVARPLKTAKYSNETYAATIGLRSSTNGQHGTGSVKVIPDAIGGVLGTRKAKNFTLRIYCHETVRTAEDVSTNIRSSVFFALVFVPEGTEPSLFNVGDGTAKSLYEPNQNVILSSIIDSSQVYTFKTRLARNLNAGDSIMLLLWDNNYPAAANLSMFTSLAFSCNYAISF